VFEARVLNYLLLVHSEQHFPVSAGPSSRSSERYAGHYWQSRRSGSTMGYRVPIRDLLVLYHSMDRECTIKLLLIQSSNIFPEL
jgi:hypothetical protein